MTQKKAAEALNKALSTVKGWETGKSDPGSLDEVVRVCQLYGITTDHYLIGLTKKRCISDREEEILTVFAELDNHAADAIIEMAAKLNRLQTQES